MYPSFAKFQWFTIEYDQENKRFLLTPEYSIPNTTYASCQIGYPFPTWEEALSEGGRYSKQIKAINDRWRR